MKKVMLLLASIALISLANSVLIAQKRAENPIITHMYTADPTARVWEDGQLYL